MNYKNNIESRIFKEIRDNKEITEYAMRLYVENRISYRRFTEIVKEALKK